MNPDMSKFIEGSRLAPRWQQRWWWVQPSQQLGYFSSLWLSFSLSFWIFLAIVGLEFWVFYWVCWGFCCLGLLRFLFNFFCLGFFCWMHRMFGVFVKFFGWWICCYNSLSVCDLNSFTLLLELWVCLWWSFFLFILIILSFVALWYCFFLCIDLGSHYV